MVTNHVDAVRTVSKQGDLFILNFPYDPVVVGYVKEHLTGRRFDPENKCWTVPASSEALVQKFAEDWGFTWADNITYIPPVKAPTPATRRVAGEVVIGDRIEVVTSYDPVLVDKIKQIEGRRWDADNKYWTLPIEKITEALALADEYKLIVRDAPSAEPLEEEEPF